MGGTSELQCDRVSRHRPEHLVAKGGQRFGALTFIEIFSLFFTQSLILGNGMWDAFNLFQSWSILNNLPCDNRKFPWDSSWIGWSEYGPLTNMPGDWTRSFPATVARSSRGVEIPLRFRFNRRKPPSKSFLMQEDFEGGSAVGSAGSVGSLQSQRWYLSFPLSSVGDENVVKFRAMFWVSGSGMEGLARLFRKERIVQDSDIEDGKMGSLSFSIQDEL